MLAQLRQQLEESPTRTLFVLVGDYEVVEELAPVAGHRNAEARLAPTSAGRHESKASFQLSTEGLKRPGGAGRKVLALESPNITFGP